MEKDKIRNQELIMHVFKNYNDSFYIENNHDDVLADEFETADEAFEYADRMYPEATIYRYQS